tara:strand:- start:322 stop:1080 length:759 start_codon:yes stop_codon:yes gene_type:complete
MGFLRKVGRKIKKGVKKLFKSKIGRILGGIGLSMIFWGGAKALFGQTQWWQNMQTGLNKLTKPFGTSDVTNAVNETSKVMDVATASKDVVTPTVTKDIPLIDKVSSTASSTPRVVDAATAVKDITPAEVLKDRPLIDTIDNPRFTDRVKDFFTPDGGRRIKEYFGNDFVPDLAKGVVTNVALDAVAGTPEQPFVGGGIMPAPIQEQAQAAYMADLNASMPQSGIQNFQQAQQSLLYGTLSPYYLQEQARMYS